MWAGNSWKWDSITPYLPPIFCHKLEAIFLAPDIQKEDGYAWRHMSTGLFLVKSAYKLALPVVESSGSQVWRRIWTLKVPQRILSILWLVFHDRFDDKFRKVSKGFYFVSRLLSLWCSWRINVAYSTGLSSRTTGLGVYLGQGFDVALVLLSKQDWFAQGSSLSSLLFLNTKGISILCITIWWIWRWRKEYIFRNNNIALRSKIACLRAQVSANDSAWLHHLLTWNVQSWLFHEFLRRMVGVSLTLMGHVRGS